MNEQQAREAFAAALAEVAPEADPDAIDPRLDLGEQLEIDSIDFLNLVVALARRTGVEVPERDYPQLRTVDGAVAYLVLTKGAVR
jgi:acyl carrier protein